MRALAALFALLLMGAAAPANQPSFSCTRTLSPSEAAICASPELSAWDRAIALFYVVQRKHSQITVAQQKDWLSVRDLCGADHTCLRRSFADWPGFPMVAPFGASFERPARYDGAGLEIAPIGSGWYAFSVQAIHIVFDQRGKILTANEGTAAGVIFITAGRGHFSIDPGDEYSCEIDFARSRDGWQLKDNGQCGGLNVTLTGNYRPFRAGQRM